MRSRQKSKPKAHPRASKRSGISLSKLIPITPRDKAAGRWFTKLVALQTRLYGPGGCPWDREQTHESLRKYLIEETYEVLDAMDSGDPRKFLGELGDLLLQVIFHSILAEKSGRFTISDVIESIHKKMVRRHPHVFGDVEAKNSAAVLKNWEQIKAQERAEQAGSLGNRSVSSTNGRERHALAPESVLSGVPRSLPAVLEAYQLTRRASHVGFDWDNLPEIFSKLDEEKREVLSELSPKAGKSPRKPSVEAKNGAPASKGRETQTQRLEEEVGDLLFVSVNVARFLGVDPEIALKKANKKFKKRFNWMEESARREGGRFADLKRSRKEELWNESKRHV